MPKKKHGLFGLYSSDIDYTGKNWNCFIKFSSYMLYSFPKIACNLNISYCGRMWAWSCERSQESFFLNRW